MADIAADTANRAVVVIEGGGSPHAYTTPWDTCDSGRPPYMQALVDAGLPVFTAPGFANTATSVTGETGCPPQPPLEVQWNTSGYPTQAGEAVLGFLGYLQQTYGYDTFDLVGYSYGGLVARATVAALKNPQENPAPAFSYAQAAVAEGVNIPSIVTMNSPHLGGPAYDIAENPESSFNLVSESWGQQYAELAESLVDFEENRGAGAIQVLRTSAHAAPDPNNWDERQVGMLDDVAVTMLAGDYCGLTCGDALSNPADDNTDSLRTDGTVPVYSQLMLPCPEPCPLPPGSVYIPPDLLPADNVERRIFPTVHSTFVTSVLDLPKDLSVSHNREAIDFLVNTVTSRWDQSGVSRAPTNSN